MNTTVLEKTLQDFTNYSVEVGGAVLISPEGQLITPSIGIEENTTLIVAGTLLQVSNRVASECAWHKTEHISVQAKEGYLTLLRCTDEAFILIKTNCVPNGSLQREIQQIVRKLESELNSSQAPSTYPVITAAFSPIPKETSKITYSKIDLHSKQEFFAYCQEQLAEFIGPIATVICQRLLKQNPELSNTDFVEALLKVIPNPQQALEFREKVFSWQSNLN